MSLPRTVLFYAAPPVILGTLFSVYRIWFSGDKDTPDPVTPPSSMVQPSGPLDPFGGGTPAVDPRPKTGHSEVSRPAPAAAKVAHDPVYDLDSAARLLQELAAGLYAAVPDVAQWVKGPDVVRRAVAAVDCVAQGSSPRRHLASLAPTQPFVARQTATGWVIEPATYSRYDRVVAAFCTGDAGQVAAAYRRLEPALDLAYRQLGYGDGRFRDVLAQAAAELLAVPVPKEPVAVVPSGRTFAYADAALEGQNDARKHLLRLGPAHIGRVQARIRELSAALNLTVAAR